MPVSAEARTANISIQPMSNELLPGEPYTLSVIATSPNNGTLSYQWYRKDSEYAEPVSLKKGG